MELANWKEPLADFSNQHAADKMTIQNLAKELCDKIHVFPPWLAWLNGSDVIHPENLKDAGSIPGQGTRPGCRLGTWLGVCKGQPVNISLTCQYFFPFLPLSLKLNK